MEKHKCPSTDKWINEIWYIPTMKYYSVIKGMKYRYIPQHGGTLTAFAK